MEEHTPDKGEVSGSNPLRPKFIFFFKKKGGIV